MSSQDIRKLLFWILVLAAVIVAFEVGSDKSVPLLTKIGMYGGGALFVMIVVFVAWARRSPGTRIALLLQQKKVEDACSLSRALLAQKRRDPVVRLNAVAAFFAAGDQDEARRILEGVDPRALNPTLLHVYNNWKTKLAPSSPPA